MVRGGSCPVVGFGVCVVESSCCATRELGSE
jgi:hypothetical protein